MMARPVYIPPRDPPLRTKYLKVHMRGAHWREPTPRRPIGVALLIVAIFVFGALLGAAAMWIAIGGA